MSAAESRRGGRRVIYCLAPGSRRDLLDPLRAHFAGDPEVEVIVEMRARERREAGDRRRGARLAEVERRWSSYGDRRIAERRVPVRVLPRIAGVRAADQGPDRVVFVERVEPLASGEDADTERLIRRVRAGDRHLFARVYARYFDRVYAYLRHVLRDASEAEDATQQTFLQALEALPRFDSSRAPFRAWLFVIARNHALNRLASRASVELRDPDELARTREAEARRVEESVGWLLDRWLVSEVERLPEPQREVLVLRTLLDMPFDAIAQRMGRRGDDVRALHSRATRSLKGRLDTGRELASVAS